MDRRNAVILFPPLGGGLGECDTACGAHRRLVHELGNDLETSSFDLVIPVLDPPLLSHEKQTVHSWISEKAKTDPPSGFGENSPLRVVTLEGEDVAEVCRQMVLFAFEDGYERAILLRPNCSELDRVWLDEAFERMTQGVETIIGTSPGGDVVAVGVDGVYLELFRDIPWESTGVASVMEERARSWHLAIEVAGPFAVIEYGSR